jgi:uncharacterized protein (DUF924 family)
MQPSAILHFWFSEIKPSQWWAKSNDFDALIQARFRATLEAAQRCELFRWRETSEGALAEIIVLDQFSRNIYRNDPCAFSNDALALALAQIAVARSLDISLALEQRAFMYMPYMHSESALIHEQAVTLFGQPGLEGSLKSEMQHKAIIDRFGRYPHRNAILGKQSTVDELAFLEQPGSGF